MPIIQFYTFKSNPYKCTVSLPQLCSNHWALTLCSCVIVLCVLLRWEAQTFFKHLPTRDHSAATESILSCDLLSE